MLIRFIDSECNLNMSAVAYGIKELTNHGRPVKSKIRKIRGLGYFCLDFTFHVGILGTFSPTSLEKNHIFFP